MQMRKILLLITAIVVVSSLAAIAAPAAKPDPNVVAVVNGDKITKDELSRMLYDWSAPMALEDLIVMRLVGQEAKKQGVSVTMEEIKQVMDEQSKQLPPGMDLDDALGRMGWTRGRWFAMIKMDQQMTKIVKKNLKVKPEDLANYRKISQIMVRITTKPNEDKAKAEQAAQERMAKIAERIKGGEAFADVAKTDSDDIRTKEKGGDMGWMPKNTLPPEVEQAIEKLKPGEVSEPVKTTFALYLVKLDKTSNEMTADERKDLEQRIIQGQLPEKKNELVMKLKEQGKIINYLRPEKPKPPTPPGPAPGQSDAEAATGATPPPPPPPAPSEGATPPPPPAPAEGGTPPPPPAPPTPPSGAPAPPPAPPAPPAPAQ